MCTMCTCTRNGISHIRVSATVFRYLISGILLHNMKTNIAKRHNLTVSDSSFTTEYFHPPTHRQETDSYTIPEVSPPSY
jgi:hypothetical protein